MTLVKILERAGFKRNFEEEFRRDSIGFASAPDFFEALRDDEKAAELKKELEARDFVLTSSFQLIEDKGTEESRERGTIVHTYKLGVSPIRDIKIPYTEKSPINIMPELSGKTLPEVIEDHTWFDYLWSLTGLAFTNLKGIKESLEKIADPEKIIIATPKLEKRRGNLVTMITLNRIDVKNNGYLIIGSIYDPNSTIAYPLVEVPN